MEAVGGQRILALQDLDPAHFRHDNDGASHSAVRASAAADRIKAVAERHLETNCTAVALASPKVRVAYHVAYVSCSDHFYAQSWWADENVLVTSTGRKPAVRLEPCSFHYWLTETDLNTNVSVKFEPDNPSGIRA